ncbi:tRNA (guanosine(18)-2'-O)-methyltransferase TrmH [Kangiella sediminilitoris]|uniref:tRNA (guanosine(18)-2'-O)-methyltransferase n=1 Tax=Kangiella sediminilitoris TaxID=1144748 RepID=A0A1B3B7Z7_9GAMM|nr:tRNA (guanosine(18)-2'-O)-methyltransferase TrmH [Kangiella sediminilitoris]AOE48915.1 tRNA methyltransferase [Kangiella sediminilitoris]
MLDRSPTRYQKIIELLSNRQPDLTVFMDEVHKPHNLAAIVRTADAVGIGHVHAVFPPEVSYSGHHTSSGSKRWVTTHKHPDLQTGIKEVKSQGMQVLAAHFSDKAVDFRSIDYTKPTCILVGSELVGVSDEAAELADKHVIIPMVGMVQSLNVSVATALILYEAQSQRDEAGMYGEMKVPQEEVDYILFNALHPTIKKYCDKHQMRYPKLDDQGEIDDPEWDQLRRKI